MHHAHAGAEQWRAATRQLPVISVLTGCQAAIERATTLDRRGATGERFVFAVAADFQTEVEIVSTRHQLLRIGDALVVDLVVPAPLVAVAIFLGERHQRVEPIVGMVVQVDHAGINHASRFDNHRVFGGVGERFALPGDSHDLAIGEPDAGIGEYIAGVVHGDHFAADDQARIWLPLRVCATAY